MDERLARTLNHPATMPIFVGAITFGIGVGIGWALRGREDILVDYEEKIEEVVVADPELPFPLAVNPNLTLGEIKKANEYLDEEIPSVVIDYKDYSAINKIDSQIESIDEDDEVPELIAVSVFPPDEETPWDYSAEVVTRTEDAPYTIHRDEFFKDDFGYIQSTLTYYSGDDVLTDEEDEPIYNALDVVGELNFGHGSNDPNVVYIRNPDKKGEYEVLRHSGHYSVEVLGNEIEEQAQAADLKHSANRRFRNHEE